MKYKIFINDVYAGNITSVLNENENLLEWKYIQKSVIGNIKIKAIFNNDLIIKHLNYEYINGNNSYVCDIELKDKKDYYEYIINNELYISYKPIIIQEMLFLYSDIKWIEEGILYDIKNNNFQLINCKKLLNKIIILGPIYYIILLDIDSNVETVNNVYTGLRINIDKNEKKY